jgi:HEPN domain-containing protein
LSQRSRRLLEEAIRDLEISCYNKATSASYFAVRMLAEETLRQLDEHIPRRGDKLANAIKIKVLGGEATAMVILYALGKKADHEAGVEKGS